MKNQRKATILVAGFLATVCAVSGAVQLSKTTANADATIATTSLVTAGEGTTLLAETSWKSYFDYQVGTYFAAYCAPGSGSVRTNLIDLSAFDKEDDLFRWTSYGDIDSYTIKLIDAVDESNYLSLSFVPNKNMTYGTTYLGSISQWTYKNTSGEYVSTGGVYEWGAILGYWGDLLNAFNNEGGAGLDINADGNYTWLGWGTCNENGVDRDIVEFTLAYEDGEFYTPRKTWTGGDFVDWVGFAGTQVYAEFSWTTAKNGHGVAFHTIAGVDTARASVAKATPVITAQSVADVMQGEEVTIPQASAYAYTHSVAATASVFYKDGETWADKTALVADGKFTPDAVGEWKIVYTADDGSGVTAESAFAVETAPVEVKTVATTSLVTAGDNTVLLPEENWQKYFDYTGTYLAAYSSVAGAGSVRTKLIDLSMLTKEDYLFQWRSYGDIDSYTVKLIDAADESNYIELSFVPNNNMTHAGTSLGSNSKWTYKNASGEYVSTGNAYEWGAIMGYWDGLLAVFENGGDGMDINGDGVYEWVGYGTNYANGVDRDIVKFSLAYEDGVFFTPRKAWGKDDFADWVGFAGTQVYAEFSWTTSKDGHGVSLDTIAGHNVMGKQVVQDVPVFLEQDEITAVVDSELTIPAAKIYCYTHDVDTTVAVFYKDGEAWVDKTALVADGKFTPDEMGEWKFVYTTNDDNQISQEVLFNVDIKEIEGGVDDYQSVYFVGETWTFNPLTVSNMVEGEYTVAYAVIKDGEEVALPAQLSFALTADYIGEYVLTYTITSLRGAELTITKSFAVCAYPSLDSAYTLEVGASITDIEFPVFEAGWNMNVALYAANDTEKANALPIVNLAAGEYVMDVMITIDGRTENVVLSATVTVEEPVIDNPGTDNPGTDNPGTDEPGTDNPSEQPKEEPNKDLIGNMQEMFGCSSSIGGLGIGFTALVAGVALIFRKKKED